MAILMLAHAAKLGQTCPASERTSTTCRSAACESCRVSECSGGTSRSGDASKSAVHLESQIHRGLRQTNIEQTRLVANTSIHNGEPAPIRVPSHRVSIANLRSPARTSAPHPRRCRSQLTLYAFQSGTAHQVVTQQDAPIKLQIFHRE